LRVRWVVDYFLAVGLLAGVVTVTAATARASTVGIVE
jgi:hypothetical protein